MKSGSDLRTRATRAKIIPIINRYDWIIGEQYTYLQWSHCNCSLDLIEHMQKRRTNGTCQFEGCRVAKLPTARVFCCSFLVWFYVLLSMVDCCYWLLLVVKLRIGSIYLGIVAGLESVRFRGEKIGRFFMGLQFFSNVWWKF